MHFSQNRLSEKTWDALNNLDDDAKEVICYLSRYTETHRSPANRCSLERIASLPSGEDRQAIWRLPAVSAWLRSGQNPYRLQTLGGNGRGTWVLKRLRTLLGHEDVNYSVLDRREMSETTSRVLSDQRVSQRTRRHYLAVLCHLAAFVENHPDPAIRCTLEDIVNFPGENGVWGNGSVYAWLRLEDNPYRPRSDGGNGDGSKAIRSLRRDFGKADDQ